MRMLDKIKALEKASLLLEPQQTQREVWKAEVFNYANTFINQLETAKAYCDSEENGKGIYDLTITEEATALPTLLESTTNHIDKAGINTASGGHLGYFPGGGYHESKTINR